MYPPCPKITVFVILLYSLPSLSVGAQSGPYGLRVFDIRDGLPQMKVNDVVEDAKGNLWLATRGGLSKFDGEKFTNYTTKSGLLSDRVHGVAVMGDGRIAVLSLNGLSIFDGATFQHYRQPFLEVEYQMIIRPDNVLWVVGNNGVWEQKQDRLYLLDRFVNAPGKTLRFDPVRSTICSNDNRAYYCFTDQQWELICRQVPRNYWGDIKLYGHIDHQVIFAEPGKGTEIHFGHYSGNRLVTGMIFDPTTQSIRLTDTSGMYVFANDRLRYRTKAGEQIDLRYHFNYVHKIIETSTGQIVIASDVGLGIIPPQYFYTIETSNLPNIWTLGEGPDQNLYAFSYQQGAYSINPDPFQIRKIRGQAVEQVDFFLGSVSDAAGNLYLPNSKGYTRITKSELLQVPTKEGNFTLGFDPFHQRILRGTYGGVAYVDDHGSTILIDSTFGIHPNYYIQSIAVDARGRYWMGSYSGLSAFDPYTMKAIPYDVVDSSLFANGAYGMYADRDILWVGNNDGLVYGDLNNLSFAVVNSVVVNSMVKAIVPYNDSTLLLGSKNGLYLFNTAKYLRSQIVDMRPLNLSAGFSGIEPHFNGLYKDSKGRIWVASANNLSVLSADKDLSQCAFKLQPNFMRINDHRVGFEHADTVFQLPRGVEDLQIQWEASGIVRPEKVLCQWKLNNNPWSDWTDQSPLRLNDLAHGHYRLFLRVGPSDLPIGQLPEDVLSFQIHLPVYSRSWFKWIASFLALIFFGSYLFAYFRNQWARKRYVEKLKENNYLKNQLLLTELNPHFIFNALSSIQHKIMTDDKLKASQQLVRLSKLIRAFLSSTFRGNFGTDQPNGTLISLAEEIQLVRYYLDFEMEKCNGKFSYTINYPESLSPDNVFLPPMLLQPLVENAIKHGLLPKAGQGHLQLEITETDQYICISIQDDGIGMEASKAKKAQKMIKDQSLGHHIIKERIRVLAELGHPIEMTFHIPEGGGTQVNLMIYNE